MNLNTVSSLNINTDFNTLKAITNMVDNATDVVSFWGARQVRYVDDEGKDQYISLNQLAEKVKAVISNIPTIDKMNTQRLEQWFSLAESIWTSHKMSDEAIETSRYVTQFFALLRDAWDTIRSLYADIQYSDGDNPTEFGVFQERPCEKMQLVKGVRIVRDINTFETTEERGIFKDRNLIKGERVTFDADGERTAYVRV